MTMDLLRTKFYMPPLRPSLVARPRLLQRLDETLQYHRPLTLVSAPAGYGKSTLITAWLHQINARTPLERRPRQVWLSLDKDDNDVARFLAYLAAALQAIGVVMGSDWRRLREMSPLPPVETLVTALLNDLMEQNDDHSVLVVLDDYHQIETTAIHDALRFWLDHAPERLHLILITRQDPPFSLSRWRARDHLSEIRAGDLRFTQAEAAMFLNETMRLSLTADDVAALERRTEGWVAGLQLAALALQSPYKGPDQRDIASFIAAFSGSHRYIIDYLVEEVLLQQDEDVRDFLYRTAILSRFTPSLCDAAVGHGGSSEILSYLERTNLFLVPLDDQRQWYRYHHLLADSLRVGVDEATQIEGHRRAAAWFADQRLFPEAIDHADAAGDSQEVARLVRLASGPAFLRGEISQIAAWMERLPHAQVMRDPEFGLYYLVSLILTGRSQEAPVVVAALDQHSAGWQDEHQQARLLVMKAWVADIVDSPQRVPLAQQAAATVGADDPFYSAFAAVPLGHFHLLQGRLSDAVAVFRQGLTLARMQSMTLVRLSLLGNLVTALNYSGHRQEAWAVCSQVVEEFSDGRGNPLPLASLVYLLRAWLHYDANQLEAASEDAALAGKLMSLAFGETILSPLQIELPALLHAAAGEMEQALAAVQEERQRAERQRYTQAARAAHRLDADLRLRCGQPVAARRWADDRIDLSGRDADGVWRAVEPAKDLAYLVYVRLLLAEERHQEAMSLLPLLRDAALACQRDRSLVSILLLYALLADDPLPPAREALQRAQAEQYRRLIIDECTYPAHGERLVNLLQRDAVRSAAPDFVDALLASLPAGPDLTATGTAHAPQLLEPLTDQELVVLRLLAAGRSNRDIAEALVITVGTAKWHVHNIYGKLGVASRAEAVARIHQWNLI